LLLLDRLQPSPPFGLFETCVFDIAQHGVEIDGLLATLEAAGAEVLYLESPIEHSIDPQVIPRLRALVSAADSD